MKVQVIKSCKWCVGSNVYPSDFVEGIYDLDDATAQDMIDSGYAVCAKDAPTAKEVELPQENICNSEGWNTESPFTEEAGGELSASPQEIASQEKITQKQKTKGVKAGE